MKKTTYMAMVASIAMMGTAAAADLPSRRAPPVYVPPPVPVFTWTGFYIGGQVGYEFGQTTNLLFAPGGAGVAAIGPYPIGQTAAAIGGVHVGYLYQMPGAAFIGGGLVAGLEGDIEGSNNTSSTVLAGVLLDQHKAQIEGSIRGRLGIAVDRALFYATGGAAFAQFKDSLTGLGAGAGILSIQNSASKVGYTVGGGVAYAITPNWSVRGEYRYTDFGNYTQALVPGVFQRHKVEEQKVEFGVSYRFAEDVVPVVARY